VVDRAAAVARIAADAFKDSDDAAALVFETLEQLLQQASDMASDLTERLQPE
jgi:hypothetical protein